MKELNGDYLDTTLTANKTNWYNSQWGSSTNKPVLRQTGIFNYINVIKEKYQNMISNSVWNIGGNSYTGSAPYTLNLLTQQKRERDKITYQNSRSTTWTGKVGLIYVSDYGYASTNLECHNNLKASLCKTNNWLDNKSSLWTLSPHFNDPRSVFYVHGDGTIDNNNAYASYDVFPTLYLSSSVNIINGNGSASNPYILSIQIKIEPVQLTVSLNKLDDLKDFYFVNDQIIYVIEKSSLKRLQIEIRLYYFVVIKRRNTNIKRKLVFLFLF